MNADALMARALGPSRFMQSQMMAPVAMIALAVHQKTAELSGLPIGIGTTTTAHAINTAAGTC